MNTRINNKDSIIRAYEEAIQSLTDNNTLKADAAELQNVCDVVMEIMRQMVHDNARIAQDQDEYQHKYSAFVERYDKSKAKLDEVTQTIAQRNTKRIELGRFVKELNARDTLLKEIDVGPLNAVIDKLVVHSATEVTIVFKDGSEQSWNI